MTTWARIVNNQAVDVTTVNPTTIFHADVAAEFVVVTDGTENGATTTDGGKTWTNPPPQPVPPSPPAPYVPNMVSVPVFKLLFSQQEEVGIYGRVSSDPNIARLVALVDDPRTTEIDLNYPPFQERVKYLGTVAPATPADGLPLSSTRLSQVLAGVPQ